MAGRVSKDSSTCLRMFLDASQWLGSCTVPCRGFWTLLLSWSPCAMDPTNPPFHTHPYSDAAGHKTAQRGRAKTYPPKGNRTSARHACKGPQREGILLRVRCLSAFLVFVVCVLMLMFCCDALSACVSVRWLGFGFGFDPPVRGTSSHTKRPLREAADGFVAVPTARPKECPEAPPRTVQISPLPQLVRVFSYVAVGQK